jgi:sec-independent protein translocase protein TatA
MILFFKKRRIVMFEGLFQPMHLILILAIALVIFGPGKIAGLGGALGKSIGDFKKAMNDSKQDAKNEMTSINRSLLEDHPIPQGDIPKSVKQPEAATRT